MALALRLERPRGIGTAHGEPELAKDAAKLAPLDRRARGQSRRLGDHLGEARLEQRAERPAADRRIGVAEPVAEEGDVPRLSFAEGPEAARIGEERVDREDARVLLL